MTTEPTTTIDVFTAMERLCDVQVSEHVTEAIKKIRQIHEEIEPAIREAVEISAMLEANASIVIAGIENNFDEETRETHDMDGLHDGLFSLASSLSGQRALHWALSDLSELCDPDSVTLTRVEEAKKQLEAERAE